jgi:hypothetical protein
MPCFFPPVLALTTGLQMDSGMLFFDVMLFWVYGDR